MNNVETNFATPNDNEIMHSGAGRIGRIRMRTMSLFESGDSSGEVSLIKLFDKPWNGDLFTNQIRLEQLIHLTVRGGWPEALGIETEGAMELSRSYLNSIIERDIRTIGRKRRDTREMRMLLRSLARNESITVNKGILVRDMEDAEDETLSHPTLSDYLDLLSRLYIIEEQTAFDPNIRSSVRVGKSPKIQFTDPSLAIAALGATPEMLMGNLDTYESMFESMCIRDLRIYAESFEGRVHHYHDGDGREIDAIIELPDGRWGAFEIKLGVNRIDEAAEKLLKIDELTSESNRSKKPSVLCVICGLSSAAYKRDDGIFVIPITALKN